MAKKKKARVTGHSDPTRAEELDQCILSMKCFHAGRHSYEVMNHDLTFDIGSVTWLMCRVCGKLLTLDNHVSNKMTKLSIKLEKLIKKENEKL